MYFVPKSMFSVNQLEEFINILKHHNQRMFGGFKDFY
jgi:hypothetical protein